MKCKKCDSEFNAVMASCGTGYSWNLYKCPDCEQLYAKATTNGFLPKEVLQGKRVEVIK